MKRPARVKALTNSVLLPLQGALFLPYSLCLYLQYIEWIRQGCHTLLWFALWSRIAMNYP